MRTIAKNFSDLQNPSRISGAGAHSEFILEGASLKDGITLGATVLIKDFRDESVQWLSGRITSVRSLSPFIADRDIMLYNRAGKEESSSLLDDLHGPHDEERIVVSVNIEMELSKQPSGQFIQQPVQRPVSNRSTMMIPRMEGDDSGEPSMHDILGLRANGVVVGYIGAGNQPREEDGVFLPYLLDLANLDNKHMFVVGESGSGKTVLLKKLAMEFRGLEVGGQKSRVIMTDVQGDLLQLLTGQMVETIPRTGWQARIASSSGNGVESMGPFQLILPMTKRPDEKRMAAIKTMVKQHGHVVKEIGLRFQDTEHVQEFEYLLRLASEQAPMLIDEVIDKFRQEPKEHTLERVMNEIKTMRSKANGNQFTSPEGTTYYTSTADAALRGCRFLRDIFDHHQPSLLAKENPLDCLKFDGTSIFYLEHLDSDERLMWGMQLVKWLYKHKRERGQSYVFIDEAHQLIPARPPATSGKETFLRLRDNFERLAREGRKFGINLVLGTQNPKDLDPIVPNQCPTRIVMKIDRTSARAADLADEQALIAARFGQGQLWLRSPFNGTTDWLRIHSPAPPLPHGPMVNFWSQLERQARRLVD